MEIKEVTKEVIDRYIEFVDKMISDYRTIGELVNNENQITPQRVNTALASYYTISLAIGAEYQRQKIKFVALNLENKVWEDEVFEKAKSEVINDYVEKKIKPSVKEFETRMRLRNRDEWLRRNLEIAEAEASMRFMLRMSDTIKGFDGILTTISYNSRAEMKALSLDDRMNASPDGVTKNRIRSRVPLTNAQ